MPRCNPGPVTLVTLQVNLSSEFESRAQLNEERVRPVPTRQEADGLVEQDASGVSVVLLTKVHGVEDVEELGEQTETPAVCTEVHELGHPHIQQLRGIATGRIR